MALIIRADDPRLNWLGIVSVEHTSEWSLPWRAPLAERELFGKEFLLRAIMPAGGRVAFRSDTTELTVRIEPRKMVRIELHCDGRLAEQAKMDGLDTYRFANLPAGSKRIDLWLTQHYDFRLRGLELSDGASLERVEESAPKWLTYGSSITQCRQVDWPSQSWSAIVAQTRGLNLMNLGYGSECYLDPMMARLMRDLPADYLSFSAGINIYGRPSMDLRVFRASLIGFIKTLRDGHPQVPLAVISPIFSSERETTPNPLGYTLQDMRREMAEAVAVLQAHGDRALHYVDGLHILGPDQAGTLPDGLHPDAAGNKHMAQRFMELVADGIFLRSKSCATTQRKQGNKVSEEFKFPVVDHTGEWTSNGKVFTTPENLARLKDVLENRGCVILEHWHYYGSRAPDRFVFDGFEEMIQYLKRNAVAGDAIHTWSMEDTCREDNELVVGKCPDEQGRVPSGGAY